MSDAYATSRPDDAPPLDPSSGEPAHDALKTKLYTEADDLLKQLELVSDSEVMLALRCPCGFRLMMTTDVEGFATKNARDVSIFLLSQLIIPFASHLELLSERILRNEKLRDAQRNGKLKDGGTLPTTEQVIKGYHNAPCPLRAAAQAKRVASSLAEQPGAPTAADVLPPEGGPIVPEASSPIADVPVVSHEEQVSP